MLYCVDKKVVNNQKKFILFSLSLVLLTLLVRGVGFDSYEMVRKTNISLKKEKLKLRVPASIKKQIIKRILRSKPVVNYKNEQRMLDRKIPDHAKMMRLKDGVSTTGIDPDGIYGMSNEHLAIKATAENKKKYPDHIEKLGYIIVRDMDLVEESKRVSVNINTGTYGIITGVLKIKYKDGSDYRSLLDSYEYEVSNSYEHINRVHFQFSDAEIAVKNRSILESNPNVVKVDLEILEYSRHGR